MNPSIYVITFHEFNHGILRPGPHAPLDPRFLNSDKNYIYYLIDKKVPPILAHKKTILEWELDPELHAAGSKFFGEWSFLLAEEKHAFCEYPLFMISSRFYEKNSWLKTDLNEQWDCLFSHFHHCGWGYLPSYDRPLRWIDLDWKTHIKKQVWKYKFFPYTRETYQLIENLFGINIPRDYRFTIDLFCNYIGFRSRKELLAYIEFYRPLIDYFFDSSFHLKRDISPYVKQTKAFRNEKSFTFFLELLSHLFFFVKREKLFAMHYDGYYSVDESQKKMQLLEKFELPLNVRLKRLLRWQVRRSKTEGWLAPHIPTLRKLKICK